MPDNSYENLKDALSRMNTVVKILESKIREAESSRDKIGQILIAKKIITVSDLERAIELKKKEPDKYLGQILCEMGLPQSKIIKGLHYSNKRKKLGEILVELGIITEGQLIDVLVQQQDLKGKGMHKPLGALLAQNKTISEEHYIRALSAHFSMPVVSLNGHKVAPYLQKVIGEQYALQNRIVVLQNSSAKVTAATAEPDLSVIENLEKAMPKGKYIMFYLARASEIEAYFERLYNRRQTDEDNPRIEKTSRMVLFNQGAHL